MYIITKLKFKSDIVKFSNKFKKLTAKYYPENKKGCKKMLVKDMKIILKKKKKKTNHNMVKNVPKISQKMKNKSLLSKEKIL